MNYLKKFLSKSILWKAPVTVKKWLESVVLWALTIWVGLAFVLFTGWFVVWLYGRYPL